MNRVRTRYTYLGVALVAGGGFFAPVAWLVIGYMPLVAVGMAGVILGTVSLGLGRTLPRVSVDAGQVLLEAGMDNIAALIEELGLRAQAIYLPTSLTDGVARALIPMQRDPKIPTLRRPLERRLLVRLGRGPEAFGILVATPGSAALSLGEITADSSMSEVQRGLHSILVGALNLADGVRVSGNGNVASIELVGPALSLRPHPAYSVLGSPAASIAATVAAETLGRPVSIASETANRRQHVVTLHVHDLDRP